MSQRFKPGFTIVRFNSTQFDSNNVALCFYDYADKK